MPRYQRRLPHWAPENAAVFITWRLHGSFPAREPEWEALPAGKRFDAEDRAILHASGPHYLRDSRIAECVEKTLIYGAEQLRLYELHAWVIMSNHVHILIGPHATLPRITRTLKTYSAREANAILGRTGEPFWQIESYDHWVRNDKEFANIVRYIEFNPVSAGLVTVPEGFRWSSAWKKAGQEACAT